MKSHKQKATTSELLYELREVPIINKDDPSLSLVFAYEVGLSPHFTPTVPATHRVLA